MAFTIGDRLGTDGYDVHFEKAYNELRGCYPLINREFARWVRSCHPEVRWFNREEDMGVPRHCERRKSPTILMKWWKNM